jgi:hypothetical protein
LKNEEKEVEISFFQLVKKIVCLIVERKNHSTFNFDQTAKKAKHFSSKQKS